VEVANILHVSRQDYSNLETGRTHPSPEEIEILSNIYDVDLIRYASDCMPLEYLEEQKAFKYNLSCGIIQKNRNKKGRKKFTSISEPGSATEFLDSEEEF